MSALADRQPHRLLMIRPAATVRMAAQDGPCKISMAIRRPHQKRVTAALAFYAKINGAYWRWMMLQRDRLLLVVVLIVL